MASFPSNGGMYHVLSSDSVAKVFRRLYPQAKNEGRADAFMSAVHQIGHRLIRAPLELGEPMYRLPGMHLQVRQVAVGPLLIYFAVHDQRPLVFIKGAALIPKENA